MRILVTHPGRQHSHQAALALAKAGMLAGYWAGAPCLPEHGRWVPRGLWRRFVRYGPVALPPERVRWLPWVPALRRLGDRLRPVSLAQRLDYAACRLFDRRVARRLRGLTADAVIACEISALATFRAARERGMTTLLDAPSIHHRAQDRLHGFAEPASLHRRITRIKELEIELADHVLTVSPLARESYLEAGVPPERVHSLLLGADLALFTPEAADGGERPAAFTFLFCGAMIRRKGIDLLLGAFEEVQRAEPEVRLVIAGPRWDSAHLLEASSRPGLTLVGTLPQAALARELRRADCLVLPSRNDSYGMVVAEALASGLPVLISEMVGARELVAEGENGWIVPVEDVAALAERMLWCARHRRELAAMGEACRRSAAAATWEAYHRRFADLVRSLVPAGREAA